MKKGPAISLTSVDLRIRAVEESIHLTIVDNSLIIKHHLRVGIGNCRKVEFTMNAPKVTWTLKATVDFAVSFMVFG